MKWCVDLVGRALCIIIIISLILSNLPLSTNSISEPDPISVQEPQPQSPRGAARDESDIRLNELMLTPSEGGPWVELYNSGNEPVDVDGWVLSDEDGLTYQFGDLPDMPAGSYIVVHFDHGDSDTYFGQTQVNALHIYTGWTNLRWTKHFVDSDELAVHAAYGFDIVAGGKPEVLVNRFKSGKFFYESKVDMSDEWINNPITPVTVEDNHRIKPIDIDGDGNIDIVSIYCFIASTNRVNWIKSTGNPKAVWDGAYEIDDMVGLVGLEAGNINGDNRMDVVVSRCDDPNHNIFWYECPVNPTVNPWPRYTIDNTLTQPGGVVLADLDGDNDNDIIAVGSWGDEVVWYEHPANPVNAWPKHVIAAPQGAPSPAPNPQFESVGELLVEDLDNDQKLDVVVSDAKGDRIIWYTYQTIPTGAWTSTVIDNDILGPSGLDAVDFDADGDLDLIVAATSGVIAWYPQPAQPQTSSWPRYIVDDSLHLVFYVNASDLDLDGDLDITTADRSDAKVLWYENEFLEFTAQDQCGIYINDTLTPVNLIDFVTWGAPAGAEDDNAVNAGLWPAGTFVDMTNTGLNQTLARDKTSTDNNVIGDWDVQCGVDSDIPTPGTLNYPFPTNIDLDLEYNPVVFIGGLEELNSTPPMSMPQGLCLANYSSYTFTVNVNNPWGWSRLENIQLNLTTAPSGPKLVWRQADNNFRVIDDPNNSVTLVPEACTAENDEVYNWVVNFTIIFHWWFPFEGLQDVWVNSKNYLGYCDFDLHHDVYNLVKTLNFTGAIQVSDPVSSELFEAGDWVIPGQELQVNGLKVVYDHNASEDYYPADSEFNVELIDNCGNTWLDYSSTCRSVNFSTEVPFDGLSDQYYLNLSLVDLPNGAIFNGKRSQELSIDAGFIDFVDPFPDGNSWVVPVFGVECSINIFDQENESGVDGESIEYRIATISPERVGEWLSASVIGDSAQIRPKIIAYSIEGPNNWIQWRAKDVAGNGPTYSPMNRVPVDRQGVTYHEFYPPSILIQESHEVTVEITLADVGGSGVNISTLQVAVKSVGEDYYGDWYTPEYTIDNEGPKTTDALVSGPETVRVSAIINGLSNGDNHLKFRAYDVAGNRPSDSEEYKVNVNFQTVVPIVSLLEPLNNSVVRTQYPTLKWQLETAVASSNLNFYVYMSSTKNELKQLDNTSTSLLSILDYTELKLDLALAGLPALQPNITYYWTVKPILGEGTAKIIGRCADGISNFKVFLEKSGVDLSAASTSITLYPGDNTNVSIFIRNLGIGTENFILSVRTNGEVIAELSSTQLQLGSGITEILLLTVSVHSEHDYGNFYVEVLAYSQESTAKDSLDFNVTVISKPVGESGKEKDSSNFWLWAAIMIIIIIALVIITILQYLRVRREQPSTTPAQDAEQPPEAPEPSAEEPPEAPEPSAEEPPEPLPAAEAEVPEPEPEPEVPPMADKVEAKEDEDID